jgi:hypothetical protein
MDLSLMKAWHIIMLSGKNTFTIDLCLSCEFFKSLYMRNFNWSLLVRSWILVQHSFISNYMRLMRPIASNMTLLVLFVTSMIGEKMFEHLHFTLVFPSVGCLHTMVTLYEHHNGSFSCIP